MIIDNQEDAEQFLTHVNYYRLRAYWIPFKNTDPVDAHCFKPNTQFSEVLKLYNFDQKLRALVMVAVECIEVSMRAQFANYLSLTYGPFAHYSPQFFNDQVKWKSSLAELAKEYQRSHETFARNYRIKYAEQPYPPIWIACELMSLGHLSRWFSNLKLPKDRQEIAKCYGIDEKILVSFLHHLTTVRNYCAHHARLWNRKFGIRMVTPNKKPLGAVASFNAKQPQSLYNTVTMLVNLADCISPDHSWRSQLIEAINQASPAMIIEMGFPQDWQKLPYWIK